MKKETIKHLNDVLSYREGTRTITAIEVEGDRQVGSPFFFGPGYTHQPPKSNKDYWAKWNDDVIEKMLSALVFRPTNVGWAVMAEFEVNGRKFHAQWY